MLTNFFSKKTSNKQSLSSPKEESIVTKIKNDINQLSETGVKRMEDLISNPLSEQLSYGKRVYELGFSSVEESKLYENYLDDVERSKNTLLAWNQWALKFPTYKIVTENDLHAVLVKYDLIKAPIHTFKEKIPVQNLNEIEEFNTKFSAEHRFNRPLEICAPLNMFDKDKLSEQQYVFDKNKRSFEKTDPIVLYNFLTGYHTMKLYFIITAWGPEAMDSIVFNERKN